MIGLYPWPTRLFRAYLAPTAAPMGSLNRLKTSGYFSESLTSQIPSNNYLKPASLIRAHEQLAPSSLPPRFLKRPHHRREQVFEDGAGTEVDFGGDLHAGREAVKHAVGDEVLGLEVDQGAVGERQVAARFAGLLLVGRGVAGIGAEGGDLAFDHAVFLELVGGGFDLDGFAGVDEADVLVADPDFGAEDFVVGDESHEDGAGADDGADGVGGEVFDDAPAKGGPVGGRLPRSHPSALLRGFEFVEVAAVLLFGELALGLVEFVFGVGALDLELAAIVGGDLGKLAGWLGEGGLGGLGGGFL